MSQAGLRELLKDVPPLTGKMDSTTGLIDIGTILGRPWEEDDTFVDIMNLITVLLERARHHKGISCSFHTSDWSCLIVESLFNCRHSQSSDTFLTRLWISRHVAISLWAV